MLVRKVNYSYLLRRYRWDIRQHLLSASVAINPVLMEPKKSKTSDAWAAPMFGALGAAFRYPSPREIKPMNAVVHLR